METIELTEKEFNCLNTVLRIELQSVLDKEGEYWQTLKSIKDKLERGRK